MKLSKRVLAAGDHIEVVSDLDDQGVFLIRNDVAQFIITNCDDRFSIRQSLIPSLLKRQFPGPQFDQSGIEKPFECYALIDEESTWRLNSLHNYVEAHRAIVGRQLLAGQYKDFKNSAHLKEKFIDVREFSISYSTDVSCRCVLIQLLEKIWNDLMKLKMKDEQLILNDPEMNLK